MWLWLKSLQITLKIKLGMIRTVYFDYDPTERWLINSTKKEFYALVKRLGL